MNKANIPNKTDDNRNKTTPDKPEIGQLGYGTDGRTYKWAGQQWLTPNGAPKRKGVQVLVK